MPEKRTARRQKYTAGNSKLSIVGNGGSLTARNGGPSARKGGSLTARYGEPPAVRKLESSLWKNHIGEP